MSTAFDTTKRKGLSNQQRAKLFLERDGKCHCCGTTIRAGDRWDVSHIIALELGGTNDWDNLGLILVKHHKTVTADDHAKAAKGRAIATRHLVPSEFRDRKGPPLPGTKLSGWRKPFFGKAERR